MPSDYEYYLMGCADASEAAAAPMSRWRFNILYGEFLRAKRILKDRAFLAKEALDNAHILQYTGGTLLDDMIRHGRFLHDQALQEDMPEPKMRDLPPDMGQPPRRGGWPQSGGPRTFGDGSNGPPPGSGSAGTGDREPLYPREPVLAGAGARPLPRPSEREDLSWWRT